MKFMIRSTAPAAALLVAVATVTAPRSASAWCGPGRPYASVMRPVVVFSPSTASAEWRRRKFFNRQRDFTQSSPRYEITDNDSFFQVAVDVPGVSAKDLSITLEEDGHVLSITGVRQSRSDSYSFSTKFSQSFTIDPAVDVDKFTAKLENGVLIVAAPKDLKRIEDNIRSIPITTTTVSGGAAGSASVSDKQQEEAAEEELTVVGLGSAAETETSSSTTTAAESTDPIADGSPTSDPDTEDDKKSGAEEEAGPEQQ